MIKFQTKVAREKKRVFTRIVRPIRHTREREALYRCQSLFSQQRTKNKSLRLQTAWQKVDQIVCCLYFLFVRSGLAKKFVYRQNIVQSQKGHFASRRSRVGGKGSARRNRVLAIVT